MNRNLRILRRAALLASLFLHPGLVCAGLLGYWNFDGPAGATAAERLKDLSGNNYHGNDRNAAGANRVYFNHLDVPRAPLLVPPGNENYCLDLSGADRFVVMEGVTGIAAAGAVSTAGNAFNIGGQTADGVPVGQARLTISYWYKGGGATTNGVFIAKGGDAYATPGGAAQEGWAARRFEANQRFSFVTRGMGGLPSNGAGDPGQDGGADWEYSARSGGTLANPLFGSTALPPAGTAAGIISNNLANGAWQHVALVWDGGSKHWYLNGGHLRSEAIAGAAFNGTAAPLSFGADIDPNTNNAVSARMGRVRLDEIAVWDEALTPAQIEDLARGADPRRPLRDSMRPFDFAWPPGTVSAYGSSYPSGQGPAQGIDGNPATKYRNNGGPFSGLILQNAASTAQSFVIHTAPDTPAADPVSYELYGNTGTLTSADNSGGRAETTAWTLLSAGPLTLPAARSAAGPVVSFTNTTAYPLYKIIFPAVNGAGYLQVGDFLLYSSSDGTGAPITATASRAVAEPAIPAGLSHCPASDPVANLLDDNPATRWQNYAGPGCGFIVTPAAPAAVQSLRWTTASSIISRDPAAWALYGTNDPVKSLNNSDGQGESWTLLGSGRLPHAPARSTVQPAIAVTNGVTWSSYKLIFPAGSGDLSITHLSDVQFYAAPDGTGTGLLAPGNDIRNVSVARMPQNSAASFWTGYTGGSVLPTGGPGTLGIFEDRVTGPLKRSNDGISTGNNQVYALDSPPLYARWGTTAAFSTLPGAASHPFARFSSDRIDYGDPQSGGNSGFNAAHTDFPTNTAADDNYIFQMAQGCLRVPAAGRYTFTMRGDDGSSLTIGDASWVALYSDNGRGSIIGEQLQNGTPTGDSNNLAVAEFPSAGDYNFRYCWTERAGGAWNEVLYAAGERTGYDAALFKQLGDPAGGLTLVDHRPIVEVRSSSLYVLGGQPSTLTLTLDGAYATELRLSGGTFSNADVLPLTSGGYGQLTIPAPTATTTYTLTGTRNGGSPVSSAVTVTVDAPPQLTAFLADDTAVLAGSPVGLRYSFSGLPYGTLAGAVFSLSDGVNPPVDITSSASPFTGQGGYTVTPATSTTYTLTMTHPLGNSSRAVTISTGSPPVINSFTVNDTVIRPEGTVILNWTVTGAVSGQLSPNLGAVTLPTGSVTDNPADSTTYTLTVHNDFGSATASVSSSVARPLGVSAALWTVKQAFANTAHASIGGSLNNLTETDLILNAAAGNAILRQPSVTVTGVPFIDYSDGASGLFGNNRPPPGGDGDHFALRCNATMVVNFAGTYTVGINNDDGGKLLIDLNQDGDFYVNPLNTVYNGSPALYDPGEAVILDNTEHGPTTFTGTVTLNPGNYAIQYDYFEDGGGQAGEVFYYTGSEAFLLDYTVAAPPISTPDLIISEFMADNESGLQDAQGDREDWIEIFNGTPNPIELSGYWLTDDALVPNKWQFPSRVLQPNTYLVVFASAKNTTIGAGEFHTNFRLEKDGEHLGLYKSNGMGGYTMVSGWLPVFPPQYTNRSYGFWDSEHYEGFFFTVTPGTINNGGYEGFTPDVKFSVDRGVYTTPQPVALSLPASLPNPGDFVIRYTTDGTQPSPTAGTIYSGPVTVSASVSLRAAATRQGWKSADIDTHTYIFPAEAAVQTAESATSRGFPAGSVNGQVYQYGMGGVSAAQVPEVVTALGSIPTMSLTVDQRHFSHPTTGIYSNPNARGQEVPCSLELLNEDGQGKGHFQIDCGLRIRGGFSRSTGNPKHAFRFFFANRYEGALNYRLFQMEGPNRFERMDLRCAQNYSWSFNSDPERNTFLREELSRDLQRNTGQPYSRCRYYHLYINGIYWGLYDTDERFEETFGESYIGGSEDNYDVVKSTGSPGNYTTEATTGYYNTLPAGVPPKPGDAYWSTTNSAWRVLFDKVRSARASAAQANSVFWEIQGLQPDGKTPLAGNPPPLLDVNNLIDYLLVTWYCGSFDAPMSTFVGSNNNWFGIRNPETRRGFIFKVHDFEHGMGTDRDLRAFDRIGPFGGSVNQNAYNLLPANDPLFVFRKQGVSATTYNNSGDINESNPQYLHEDLAVNSLEYRVRFWDRVHRHFFNGGALTDTGVLAALSQREATVDSVIIAEQARWGDTGTQSVNTYNTEKNNLKAWIARGSNSGNPLSTNYGRGNTIVTLLRGYRDNSASIPLYSPIQAPVFSQMGGTVASGFTFTMSIPPPNTPAGTIYYTTSGEDPRAVGGAINTAGGALAYSGTLTLTQTSRIRARVWDGTNWSALTEALFIVGNPASAASLVITEINYNPALAGPGTPNATDGAQSFEFLELQNVSALPIDLTNVAFTFGISYTFPTGRLLGPGQRIVVAKDPAAFATRYPDANYTDLSSKTVGGYTSSLDNGGERLTLTAADGTVLRDLNPYDDQAPWPETADGGGATLVFTTCPEAAAQNASSPFNWFPHALAHGNPGGPDSSSYAVWAASSGASSNGTGDGDSDGMADLFEYLFGTSPTVSSSHRGPAPGIVRLVVGNEPELPYATLSYTRALSAGDVAVSVEVSPALTPSATWSASAVFVSRSTNADATETWVWRAPSPMTPGTRVFMRLRIICDSIP
jgi:hypothetical protein